MRRALRCAAPAQVGTIEALERDVTGSRNAQWARAHKLIPGIIHGVGADGVDEVQLVYVRDADLRREVGRRGQTFSNTLFDMCVQAEGVGAGATYGAARTPVGRQPGGAWEAWLATARSAC